MLLENREEIIMCRLRGNIAIRLQGIALIGIAILCHWANADGAAVIMLMVSAGLLFGKTLNKEEK